VGLLEILLVALAQLHHGLEIHFVEAGQDGGRVLRLFHALGNARAQARHFDAFLGPRSGWRAAFEIVHHIGLGQSSAPAGGRHLGWVYAFLLDDSAGCGAQLLRVSRGRSGGRRRLSFPGGFRAGLARRGPFDLTGFDHSQDFITQHGFSGFASDLPENAICRRWNFQHHLVGFQVDQVLVPVHGLAGFLMPCGYRGVVNRFGQYRDLDFNTHGYCSRAMALCWGRLCQLTKP